MNRPAPTPKPLPDKLTDARDATLEIVNLIAALETAIADAAQIKINLFSIISDASRLQTYAMKIAIAAARLVTITTVTCWPTRSEMASADAETYATMIAIEDDDGT